MNVVIPAAGAGRRFVEADYANPKPFIEIGGKPMIQVIVDNVATSEDQVYILMRSDHLRYAKGTELTRRNNICFIMIDELTEGAACTALKAKGFINNNQPLLIANSDQYLEWNYQAFQNHISAADAALVTFTATHPKWSFVRHHPVSGNVIEVAEKTPISNVANTGVFWWKYGRDFVESAETMIAANDMVNQEFYIAPSMNYLIRDNKNVVSFHIDNFWGLGTPEDFEYFQSNFCGLVEKSG